MSLYRRSLSTLESSGSQSDGQFHAPYNDIGLVHSPRHTQRRYAQARLVALEGPGGRGSLAALPGLTYRDAVRV
jgi:hypothetical protein